MKKVKIFYISNNEKVEMLNRKLDNTFVQLNFIKLNEEMIKDKKNINIDIIAEKVYNLIRNKVSNEPYIIWGDSMGAHVAYKVSCKIRESNDLRPIHIIFSGKEAPNIEICREDKLDFSMSILNEEYNDLNKKDIERWSVFTKKECDVYTFQGNELFTDENIEIINEIIEYQYRRSGYYSFSIERVC